MPSNADIEHALKCVDRIERGCTRLDDTMDIRTCLAAYLTNGTNQTQGHDEPDVPNIAGFTTDGLTFTVTLKTPLLDGISLRRAMLPQSERCENPECETRTDGGHKENRGYTGPRCTCGAPAVCVQCPAPAGLTPREKRLVEAGRAMRNTIYAACERREAAAETWSALITELTNEVLIATACDEVTD